MIFQVIAKASNKKRSFSITSICKNFKVSRGGFYKFIKARKPGDKDINSYELIKKVFNNKHEKVGIRQIKMIIERKYSIIMNVKKIARIKRKFRLVTKIRRKSNLRKVSIMMHEHRSCPNLLKRDFRKTKADEVYSTDITQFNYGMGKKAYLAVFKDICTKEIVSSELSKHMGMEFVMIALNKAINKLSIEKRNELMIHSDQGPQFTHFLYRNKLKENGIKQSMSRKGNCLDNSPVESFFGLLKDHLDLKSCNDYLMLEKMVTSEIEYYNNQRPQWNLKKMPPNLYREQLGI